MRALQWLGVDNPALVDVGEGQRIHADTAGPFIAMQQAAAEDGVDCQLVSGFRSFERQLAIWNRKWHGERPLYDARGNRLDPERLSDTEKLHAILTFSALPGGSRHHWGSDIDVYDKASVEAWAGSFSLVNDEYCNDGPCAELASWLTEYAGRFGFARPYLDYRGGVARELWHLSHTATARQFESAVNCDTLRAYIEDVEIAGKSVILDDFERLFERYVLNKGR
ncbi:M15 family metallopeptidase [Alteromonas halophila]|uniref:D-alanyl-D-alanine carboxypeptidase n=1 Tax=Alteromonas halophila TaxID=516698 RepID=A0A918JHF2_9ALTE|nr:M15 family metallopeptidase [Alteromonas halophila]GGW76138.1 D-alanyl-D-alanine carboxypeptidase [Alteromonas halophila]